MKRWIIFLVFTLMCIVQYGCNSMYVGKEYKKDTVFIYGYKKNILSSDINYQSIEINLLKDGADLEKCPQIYLELKDDEVIFLPSIDLEWIKKKPPAWIEQRENEIIECNIDGCSFFIREHDLVMIRGGMIRGYGGIVALWDGSKTKRYKLPLSYKDLIELFGEPDENEPFYGK